MSKIKNVQSNSSDQNPSWYVELKSSYVKFSIKGVSCFITESVQKAQQCTESNVMLKIATLAN